ncbi:MAG TPA: LamB/YcsF family protein [Myxococcota bacterium]|nr:LamB/YcsF family protein [Myxococcota bacterium]HND32344.1 LamB/YcsF family protein [Myxococcota bacterium]
MLLNIDLGELEEEAEELFALASIAAVCCGAHAGGPELMRRSLRRCRAAGTLVAAHPSYPDRANFGRLRLDIPWSELEQSLRSQLRLLRELAEEEGLRVAGLKPHGALYHAAAREPELARGLLAVATEVLGEVWVIGPPGGAMGRLGVEYRVEGFADRGYAVDGSLLPRGSPGATLPVEQVLPALRGLLASGRFDCICIHGDGPHALDVARLVHQELRRSAYNSTTTGGFTGR